MAERDQGDELNSFIIAATGHRPNKCGGYSADALSRLYCFASLQLNELLHKYPVEGVISGMAQGWDQAVAWAALQENIPLIAAVPFVGQEKMWPEESQFHYRDLLSRAYEVKIICPGPYAPWKMQKRNEWMVQHADLMLAFWDGSAGGTKNCILYAEKVEVPVVNTWLAWSS